MSKRNGALMRRELEENFNRGNLGVANGIYAPDHAGHDPAGPEEIRGLEDARQYAAMFRNAFSDLRHTAKGSGRPGKRGDNTLYDSWPHRGEIESIIPASNPVEVTSVVVSRIEDSKIAEDWVDYDALGWMQQLGVVPEPARA